MKEYIEAFETILKGHFLIWNPSLERRFRYINFTGFLLDSVDPRVSIPLIKAALPPDARVAGLNNAVLRTAPPVDEIFRDIYCIQIYSSDFPPIEEGGAIPNMELRLTRKPDGELTAIVSTPEPHPGFTINLDNLDGDNLDLLGSTLTTCSEATCSKTHGECKIPVQLLRLSDLKDGDVILVKSVEDMRAVFDASQNHSEGSQNVTIAVARECIEKLPLPEAIDILESIIGVPGYHTKLASLINIVLSPYVMSSDVIQMAEDIRDQYLNHHLPGISDQLRNHE